MTTVIKAKAKKRFRVRGLLGVVLGIGGLYLAYVFRVGSPWTETTRALMQVAANAAAMSGVVLLTSYQKQLELRQMKSTLLQVGVFVAALLFFKLLGR